MVHTHFPITSKQSKDLEPFHVEKYGVQCGHSVNNFNDENLCNNGYKRYILGWVVEVSSLLSVVSRRLFFCLNLNVDFLKIYQVNLFVLVKSVGRNFKFMNSGFNWLYMCFCAIQKSWNPKSINQLRRFSCYFIKSSYTEI